MSHKIKGLLFNLVPDGDSITIAFNENGVIMELIRWKPAQLLLMKEYIDQNDPDERFSFTLTELIGHLITALSDAYEYDIWDLKE